MVKTFLGTQLAMAANHFTSASLFGSTPFHNNSKTCKCGIFSTSFMPAFHSSKLASSPQLYMRSKKSGQLNVRSEETKTLNRNMPKEMGGQWLSCTTRHVRIYAAYIDPVTLAFDQTQIDKLTLILDPSNEFIWPEDKCQKVYDYFSELVEHYEGAPLNEYTLRLIGSDLEHYIRKLLLSGEIKYNLNAKVLNFSMGKPRINLEEVEASATEDVK